MENWLSAKRQRISAPDQQGSFLDFWGPLNQEDPVFARKMLALGLPLKGRYALSSTPGELYGKAYKDFTVLTLSFFLGKVNELDATSAYGIFTVSGDEDEPFKHVWQVCFMEISRKGVDSVIRYLWDRNHFQSLVSIDNINSDLHSSINNGTEHVASDSIAKLKRLLPGLKIIEMEEKRPGRPRKTVSDSAKQDFLNRLKASYRKLQEIDGSPPAQIDVASEMNISCSTLRRRLREFGISWPPKFA